MQLYIDLINDALSKRQADHQTLSDARMMLISQMQQDNALAQRMMSDIEAKRANDEAMFKSDMQVGFALSSMLFCDFSPFHSL